MKKLLLPLSAISDWVAYLFIGPMMAAIWSLNQCLSREARKTGTRIPKRRNLLVFFKDGFILSMIAFFILIIDIPSLFLSKKADEKLCNFIDTTVLS